MNTFNFSGKKLGLGPNRSRIPDFPKQPRSSYFPSIVEREEKYIGAEIFYDPDISPPSRKVSGKFDLSRSSREKGQKLPD